MNFNRLGTHLHDVLEIIEIFQTLDRESFSHNNNTHRHSFIRICSKKELSFEWTQPILTSVSQNSLILQWSLLRIGHWHPTVSKNRSFIENHSLFTMKRCFHRWKRIFTKIYQRSFVKSGMFHAFSSVFQNHPWISMISSVPHRFSPMFSLDRCSPVISAHSSHVFICDATTSTIIDDCPDISRVKISVIRTFRITRGIHCLSSMIIDYSMSSPYSESSTLAHVALSVSTGIRVLPHVSFIRSFQRNCQDVASRAGNGQWSTRVLT